MAEMVRCFAWSHASFRFKSSGYWCVEFFERQLNTSQETSFTHFGNTCTEHGPRDAIVPDVWWGTTREFRVRIKVTEPGDSEQGQREAVSSFSAPMTFTFPPMPVELVLAKMGAPVHATTCTSIVRGMTQAACVRQLYRWRGGLCIKETALEEIVAAITQHPQVPPAEVLSKMDVQSHTTTCSYVEHQWPQSLCAEISGEWTPPREGYKSMCVKDTALADIVEAFAEDPQ